MLHPLLGRRRREGFLESTMAATLLRNESTLWQPFAVSLNKHARYMHSVPPIIIIMHTTKHRNSSFTNNVYTHGNSKGDVHC